MRRGQFDVSNELMKSDEWSLIEAELRKVFNLETIVQGPFGVVSFHGTSELFDETVEGSSPKYDCLFTTTDGKPTFDKFIKV